MAREPLPRAAATCSRSRASSIGERPMATALDAAVPTTADAAREACCAAGR